MVVVLYIVYGSVVQINNTQFYNNSAAEGGAIVIALPIKTWFISNTTFKSNKASKKGGAISSTCNSFAFKLTYGLELIIQGGSAENNFAGESGGFSYLYKCNVVFRDEHTVTNNSAARGGAVHCI